MKIQNTKNIGVRSKKINYFTIGPSKPQRGLTHLWSGSTKKIFFNFCYWIRVEHEKCSELCARIVRFGLILIKWDHF
jgi:hypothetical protein